MQHLTLDLYLRALRGEIPLSALVRQGHAHLLEVCEVCRNEWEGGEGGESFPLPRAAEDGEGLEDVPDSWLLTQAEWDFRRQVQSQRKEAARLAREDLRSLLRQPAETWIRRVSNARTRFRSRAFAELLLEECRERVRSRPREVVILADLVPRVLAWADQFSDSPWTWPLLARAAAHRANALRVVGDLPAAEKAFRELRRSTAANPVSDPAVTAELDSLEASLAIGTRALGKAEVLLKRAASAWRQLDNRQAEASTRIQLANLKQTIGLPQEALAHFEAAAELLDQEAEPYLFACTVAGRVNTLCDLDRAAEAERYLDCHNALFTASEERYVQALHLALVGRIAHGRGRHEDAVERLTTARDRFLDLDRDFDAILASLYVADALLASERTAELRSLTSDLVPLFHARGVTRETLASLRLLARAAAAEEVNAALLIQVRRAVEEGSVSPRAGSA